MSNFHAQCRDISPRPLVTPTSLTHACLLTVLACATAVGAEAVRAPARAVVSAAHTWRPARLFEPKAITWAQLPNGVRSVVRATRGSGLVSLQVWVRAGGRFETTTTSGASRLIETLVMRASRGYPRVPLLQGDGGASEAIQHLGGVVASATTRDSTFYSATVAATYLPAAIRALADATLHPDLTDGAVEDARFEVETDLQRRAADPLAVTSDLAYKLAFSRHPYRQPAGGTIGNIDVLTGTRIRSYYHSRYLGSNIVVVIVGDVRPAVGHRLVANSFREAVAAPVQHPPSLPVEGSSLKYQAVTRHVPLQRSVTALAFRAPGIDNPRDVVAMDVLLAHWREGSGAALRSVLLGPENLEDPPSGGQDATGAAVGLVSAYDVDFLTQRDPGLIIISLLGPKDRTAAVQATLGEIARVREHAVDVAALDRAKTVLTRQYIQQGETVSGQAGALGFYEMIARYDFAVDYLHRVAAVTARDVQNVAQRYMGNGAYVQVNLEPAVHQPDTPDTGGNGVITASLPPGTG